ncbi:arylsulfatase [Flammeovirga kamogawensis]|uniref:Arylsulfatase n=1 Tax=Flammeovirga kamogawensis TaxID=373891 RepID=A0ABX8H669_9BACT|nr:arylsulfatase [Flammeovirga kamogawensis]MBB6461769.1 arylsulfatase [Flammeovirga kamogawensis]QWG10685.1 arylsulfatase [Flammeovirga kamogawensis]TRX63788.1 arylsulfatase [Flammeovirga kamogawensis]
MKTIFTTIKVVLLFIFGSNINSFAQEILPFPEKKSKSKAGVSIKTSTYLKSSKEEHLKKDAPNILIILIDDIGGGTTTTFGGEINTPNLTRVADMGVSYNRFHTTAMCSPTRASILTGRNHTKVGSGQVAEFANNWDGYSSIIPKESATMAEVLKDYGYNTSAFGKWHNTPVNETSSVGPFNHWPNAYGFDYFYGFLGGEANQYEPNLVRNNTYVEHPETSSGHDYYHLTEDLTDDAIKWLRDQKSFSPDKPFFMYWSPGAVHGPHHVTREWSKKYEGKFDDGWDNYRERVFKRQKDMGWIPGNSVLTGRDSTMQGWDDIPDDQREFQSQLMEVFAGFTEHTDYNVGRIIDELEAQGELENTLIFYIWGDNGSSSEGQKGTISELLSLNGIESNIDDHIKALDELGGLEVLGTDKVHNMYHAGWAWAGSTPYKGTKLTASYFGGTRNPMVVAWPKKINHDSIPHTQFHHVNDIVPTVYDVVGIEAPQEVNGVTQTEIDGVSMAYSFNDAEAEGTLKTQFFDIMGSRSIYSDGWVACTFGPRIPWVQGVPPNIKSWEPEYDRWELYNINEDWTESQDLSEKYPEKLEELKELFLVEATKYDDLPIGGGLWSIIYHPEDMPRTPYNEWNFTGRMIRMPEGIAPRLGTMSNTVEMDLEIPRNSNGTIYSLGDFSGGLTCFIKNGYLYYEYNLFEIKRFRFKSEQKVKMGNVKMEVISTMTSMQPKAAMDVVIKIDGEVVVKGQVPITAPVGFTANDCLDLGTDLGSPVSTMYYDKAPYKFNGEIIKTKIYYTK